MNIVLINPPTYSKKPLVRDMAAGLGFEGGKSVLLPPLDLAYLAARLQNQGDLVNLIDSAVENYRSQDIYQIIAATKPETIIVNVSLPRMESDCSFIKDLKKQTNAQVIAKTVTNHQPILQEILTRSRADYCIYGECETIIEKIIRGGEKANTAYFDEERLVVNQGKLIADLDELPLPARHLLANEKYTYILLGKKTTTVQTSRGCPFPCAYYCPYPLVQGKKWRARSPEHILGEIQDIVENHKINRILFRDAVFTLDKERAHQICDLMIRSRLPVEWWCETRIDCLDRDLLKKMAWAGCQGINLGVETGDPEVLESRAKVGVTMEKLVEIRKIAKKLDLRLHFLLMIGLPEENRQSLYQTFKLVQTLKPESLGLTIVTPYPGTPLYQEAKEKGWIRAIGWEKFGGVTPIMRTDKLSCRDLLIAQKLILLQQRWLENKLLTKFLSAGFHSWANLPRKSNA